MQKVRGMVALEGKIVRDGISSILSSIKGFEVVGREGANLFKEAFELQPDLIVFELNAANDDAYTSLTKLKELCGWTKIILYSASPYDNKSFNKFIKKCDGYLQGPLLPGYLQKAVELACYSGHFFFLGSPKDIDLNSEELALADPIQVSEN